MLIKKNIFSFLDLTSLNATDNYEVISTLVDFCIEQNQRGFSVAAVCVYSEFAAYVKQKLVSTDIKTAVVAGAFPHGLSCLETKVFEVQQMAALGVDEIDIVLNRGLLLSGDFDKAAGEIRAMRNACPNVCLKVILETGELLNETLIKQATEIVINAQADFVKTSTGKCPIGATPEAVQWMCEILKQHFDKTGKKIGLKVSGGVRSENDALEYIKIVQEILGDSWLHPDLFRIGASSLAHDLIKKS
jgi:deoxyribose-phosphate aldolase